MTKNTFWQLLLLLMLLLSQPLFAQTSLPACTTEIADIDGDQTNDNDGADGIIDIDKDGDGLIEICDLEGLNEMRHQLDGSGYTTSTDAIKITQGCPRSGCRGYELVKDLDFNAADSYRDNIVDTTWTTSTGWSPIGSTRLRFSGVFEGNGHTIAHLYINRSNGEYIGLFAVTANTAKINNIKLSDVNITGRDRTSSLVGWNFASIIDSDVTGTVIGGDDTGGLVGNNWGQITLCVANVIVTGRGLTGGLAGNNAGVTGVTGVTGVISESSASGNVMGSTGVGGLVGGNDGSIANTYATGDVLGDIHVGGLVGGRFANSSRITNSYAIGKPSGISNSSSNIGGLFGGGSTIGVFTANYWDTEASMHARRGNYEAEFAKTTTELKSPTEPGTTSTEIYYGWSEEIWDFGSTNTYPLLRFTTDSDFIYKDIDIDDDGLIEIYDLEGLNEIRYQLDGNGYKTSASGTKITQGCPEFGCYGYELMKDLDFNSDASYRTTSNKVTWTTGSGWSPIGSDSNRFSSIFEGNGFTISGLYISRGSSSDLGLFSLLSLNGEIKNIGLLDVSIVGADNIGGLVGHNFGLIINSYVSTATIVGNEQIGGLVGSNQEGSMISSFAYADVIGLSNVGGLVGSNNAGIINTYAAGTVSSTQTVSHAGGLVGRSSSNGEIRNSYTISQVMPLTDENSQVGGLVGDDSGSITASYWDKTVNADLTTSSDAKTTAELQNPTAPGATLTDTYYGWRTAAWNFGNRIHYPILYYATTDSITVSACADNPPPSSTLPRCGSLIPNQTIRNLTPTIKLPPLTVSDIELSFQPPANADGTINEGSTATLTFEVSGGTDVYQYEFKIDDDVSTSSTPLFIYSIADDFIATDAISQTVTLTIRVSDQSAKIEDFEHTEELHIRKTNNGPADINISITSATLTTTVGIDPDGDATTPSYTYRWQTKTGSDWMTIASTTNASYTINGDLASASGEFRVQVIYTDGQGYSEMPVSNEVSYTPTSKLPPLMVSDIELSFQPPANADGTINEGSTATLTFNVSGGTDVYQYEFKIDDDVSTSSAPLFIYSIADDFIAADATSQTVTLTIKVSDQSDEIEDFEHIEELHIRKTNNGPADINLSITSATLTTTVGTDLDGDPNPPSYTYRWQTNTGSEWMTIASTTDTSYTISGNLASARGEFRVQVTYTDGQDYLETLISNAIRYIPPSELQPLMVSDIQLSFQPPANADGTINEGSTATLTFEVSGGTDVYQYESKIDDAAYTLFVPPFIYSIADDFIATDATSQTVKLTIRVSDQSDQIEDFEHTEELHIRKTNNGSADINLSITSATLTATVGTDPDGDPNPPSYTYRWQTKTGSEWMTIASTTDTSYTISGDLASARGEFRVQVTYTDGQDYLETPISNVIRYIPPSELQPLMVSNIQLSVQPPANTDGTINEGSTATLTFNVSGGTDVYQYESKIDDAAEYTPFEPPFIYSIADDFIATDATSQTVKLTIRVSDQSDQIEDFEHTEELHIRKTNNGSADINLSITSATLTATVGTDPDGDPNPLNYTYQWQTNTGSEWMTIASTTDTSYTISGDLASARGEFRVQVTYTDGQDYLETPISNVIRYIPPSELQPLMVSNIQLSVQPPANADGTINEGSTATLTFEVSGGTDVYQYESKIDDAAYTPFEPPFIYGIADDFIATDATSQTVKLTIRVSDQSDQIEDFEHTEELHIRKTNNGSADINISITSATLTATVGTDPDGDPNPLNYTYQWQTNTDSGWMTIASTTDTSYTISGDLASARGEFRVQVMYTDGQGYPETPTSNAIPYTQPDSSGLRIRTKVFLEGPLR